MSGRAVYGPGVSVKENLYQTRVTLNTEWTLNDLGTGCGVRASVSDQSTSPPQPPCTHRRWNIIFPPRWRAGVAVCRLRRLLPWLAIPVAAPIVLGGLVPLQPPWCWRVRGTGADLHSAREEGVGSAVPLASRQAVLSRAAIRPALVARLPLPVYGTDPLSGGEASRAASRS